jgi:uncharacterized protein with von Willebrand factor type A (vWA) domain
VPDAVEPLVAFANELRAQGLPLGTGAVSDFCDATALLGVEDLYWAGRATLVSCPAEIPVYDRVFRSFFGPGGGGARPQPRRATALRVVAAGAGEDDEGDGEAGAPEAALASRLEVLRHKSFEHCSPAELAELAARAGLLARALPRRRSRRRRGARDGTLDVPRTLRRALRTGGEPFERRYRARRRAPRRLVLLLDVSGSMSRQSRAMLVLAHALLRERPSTEVFCFGTRLTPATRSLAVRDPWEALRRASEEVADWEGGTRIGESLKAFLDRDGHRGLARGAVVVLCSDGLDVGDPELLRAQMERLSRLAHRVVWLNPLKQDARYEPLARGMHAALPYVDVFASGHTLASLEAVAAAI